MSRFNVMLTRSKCILLLLLVLTIGYGIVSFFMKDLRHVGHNEQRVGSVSSDRIIEHQGPYPGGEINHVNWFVQISDLHLSKFHDNERVDDLLEFCRINLKVIRPEVVMVTGDLTDAKLENSQGSRQYEEEWKQYDRVLSESGILNSTTVWLDTRGNHDCFNVPSLTSSDNYFKIYSARGKFSSRSYRYIHKTSDGNKFAFIAVDACPNPGPKRPFNFFGIIDKSEYEKLEDLMESESNINQTIFFGHYPTSTIYSQHSNIRHLLGSGLVYLCGHLHTLGGVAKRLYSMQQAGFLELELSDWRDRRTYRLMAIDHGLMSFTDVNMRTWPVVLITNPKHSQFIIAKHEPLDRIAQSTHIRVLAFSNASITRVQIRIDDKVIGDCQQVGQTPLFVLPWQPDLYSTGPHSMQVHATDVAGQESLVVQQFTVDWMTTHNVDPLWKRFLLMSDFFAIFKVCFALSLIIAVLPLVVSKYINVHLQIKIASPLSYQFLQSWVRRFHLISANSKVYYALLGYNFYLLTGPWFIGEILDGEIGACFLYGLYVQGIWIPCAIIYVFGTLQLLTFSIPLTLYAGRRIDLIMSANKDQDQECCHSTVDHSSLCLIDLFLFLFIVLLQLYLAIFGFYRSYGAVAFLVCPMRLGAIAIAFFIRYASSHNISLPPRAAVPLRGREQDGTIQPMSQRTGQ